MSRKFRLAAAAVSAAALASMSLGTVAMADVLISDPNATGTITIHKYLGATQTALPNDGSVLTPEQEATILAGAEKLSGIEFDVYKVEGVDLTTNDGWLKAKELYARALTSADIANGYITGADNVQYKLVGVTTDGLETVDGVVTTEALPIGLYLVAEDLTNSSHPDAKSITPAAPFLIALPTSYDTTDPKADSWVYDLHVYPKNTQDSITKAVKDGNLGTENQDAPKIGEKLTYVLDSTVSPVSDFNGDGFVTGADLKKYIVGDYLSEYVTYQSVTMTVQDADGNVLAALVEGTDFTITKDTRTDLPGDQMEFVLTSSGLDKLVAAKTGNASAHVVTEVVAEVTSLPSSGIVPNQAYLIPNDSFTDQDTTDMVPGVPSNEVESKYGDILINKTNEAGDKQLAGAVFSLYRAGANTTCEAADFTGDPLATATTDATGQVEFSGLQLSNWYNDGTTSGEITDVTKYHNYCLVETKAPEGYQLLAEPLTVTLTKAGVTAALDGQQVDVKNLEDNLNNNLPLTGGQGTALMSIAGLALVGGGVGYYMVSNRRREAKN